MINVIEVKNLTLRFDGKAVLNSLDLSISEGEFVFVSGGNGSGKSTMVRCILGLEKGCSGEIKIMGKKNSFTTVSENISYMPQYTSIDKTFPITFNEVLELQKTNSKIFNKKFDEILDLLGVKNLMDKKIGRLSGGEFQKMQVARTLINDTPILVFDEPSNNLDFSSQKNLYTYLRKINKEDHKTIVLISHDHNVKEHTDREIFISDGNIVDHIHYGN